MNITRVIFLLSALTVFPDTGAYARNSDVAGASQVRQACPRRQIGYFQLMVELNRVQSGCVGQSECFRAVWGNLETRELSGYARRNWLWSGSGPETFTVNDQNVIVANARRLAEIARPSGKTIRAIDFFGAFTERNSSVTYYVGVRATYGNCVPGGWQPAR